MTKLYAQPYLDEIGFHFDSVKSYQEQVKDLTDSCFKIQFIDGDDIDRALFNAIGVYAGNIDQFFTAVENWDNDEKIRIIIACWECGYKFDRDTKPDNFDIDVYEVETLKELAEHFVQEGLFFGEVPDNILFYLDMDQIAYDLGMEYRAIRVAGRNLVYRRG